MKFAKCLYLVSGIYGLIVFDPAVFIGIQERSLLSAGNNSSRILFWPHWRGGRMANRVPDYLQRPKAKSAIDDRDSDRKIQLRIRGIGSVASPILVTGLIDLILGRLFSIAYRKVGK